MKIPENFDSIIVLGPTASGKTNLAVRLAHFYQTEIISIDSRQVYKELNIGSGKDLNEYQVNGKQIPYHLIDICNLNEEFNLSLFIHHLKASKDALSKNKIKPILCGGSGLYLESCLKRLELGAYQLSKDLRANLESLSTEELKTLLEKHPKFKQQYFPHDPTRMRLVRAIEALKLNDESTKATDYEVFNPIILGLNPTKEIRWERIQERLESRFKEGMVEEVIDLLSAGYSHERLQRLGLEYKYISLYLQNKLSFNEMKLTLFYEIRRFSKRQMTYFRKIEKDGFTIHWLNSDLNKDELLEYSINIIEKGAK
jgi:tRNA dimethylallyltransferase